jgi:hypothetical protein
MTRFNIRKRLVKGGVTGAKACAMLTVLCIVYVIVMTDPSCRINLTPR